MKISFVQPIAQKVKGANIKRDVGANVFEYQPGIFHPRPVERAIKLRPIAAAGVEARAPIGREIQVGSPDSFELKEAEAGPQIPASRVYADASSDRIVRDQIERIRRTQGED